MVDSTASSAGCAAARLGNADAKECLVLEGNVPLKQEKNIARGESFFFHPIGPSSPQRDSLGLPLHYFCARGPHGRIRQVYLTPKLNMWFIKIVVVFF